MRSEFEAKGSDLLGRIGTLKVGSKSLETPYMFAVIHPVRQLVPTETLASMGFGGLMTNSYIIHSRRKEEALAKKIHDPLGFDGVLMHDSVCVAPDANEEGSPSRYSVRRMQRLRCPKNR